VDVPVGPYVFAVVEAGPADGEPVVLLHGFPQTAHSWRRVTPALAAAGYRTLAPDQRGYSPGARPDGVEAYRMTELVGDVVGLLDALHLPWVHLVGHDWGAAVAWQVAGRHQDRVRTLTTVSVPHPLAFVEALTSDDDQRRRSAYMRDFALPGTENTLLADGAAQLRSALGDAGGAVDVDAIVAALGDPVVLRRCLDWYAAQSRADLAGLGPVTAPTLHVWSDGDAALGRAAAEATGAHVAGPYTFVELAGISHWIPEQAPDALSGALLEHLAAGR
jgi:pimeloyl-ACP methyl ester carboxylesterase